MLHHCCSSCRLISSPHEPHFRGFLSNSPQCGREYETYLLLTCKTQERPTMSSPKRRAIKKSQWCNPHGLWACDSFRKMTVNQRWDIAREQRVCFRCLSYGHQGEACVRSRICGLNGCRSAHHYLLHDENSVGLRTRENNRREEPENQPAQDESVLRPLSGSVTIEGELNARTHTTTLVTAPFNTPKIVALRTVPVSENKWCLAR